MARRSPDVGRIVRRRIRRSESAKLRLPAKPAFAKAITRGRGQPPTPDEEELLEGEIESQPWLFRPHVPARWRGLPRAEAPRRRGHTPRAVHSIIPALAAVLALFYRGRHYPERPLLRAALRRIRLHRADAGGIALWTTLARDRRNDADHRDAHHRRSTASWRSAAWHAGSWLATGARRWCQRDLTARCGRQRAPAVTLRASRRGEREGGSEDPPLRTRLYVAICFQFFARRSAVRQASA